MRPADDKVERLIRDHFPWGKLGAPKLPEDQALENLKALVGAWIERRLLDFGLENTALALAARIQKVVEEVEQALPESEKPRLFYRFDVSHLTKSAAGILDKMTRAWAPDGGQGPCIGFDDFGDRMEDLARFRVVLNFLSDVSDVCGQLERPYVCRPDELDRLSAAQRSLYRDFALQNHKFQNLIECRPEDRKNGERCRKGVFSLRCKPQAKVEVQIQTMLQEAWDKKDHFLIYEPRRRGEDIDLNDRIEIFAMSELLYVADLTFDRLLEAIRQRRAEAS